MPISRADFLFFCTYAGGVVGRNAVTALHLARAEQFMVDHDWNVEWPFDDSPDLSWCACHKNPRVKHNHEVLVCVLKDSAGAVLESLGGNVDVDRHYARVLVAELALEAMGPQLEKERDSARLESRRNGLRFDCRFTLWDESDWETLGTYGRWNNDGPRDRGGPYALVNYCSGSDYSGTLVERSNHDVWEKTFADGEGAWWRSVSGGYSTFAIVVRVAELPEEAIEFIEGLDSYCIADESAHSELETEAQDESWNNWARRDFARAIAARFNVDADLDDGPDAQQALSELFWRLSDETGTYWENQQGGEMYVDLDRVVAAVTTEDLDTLIATLPGPVQLPLPVVGGGE